MPADNTETMTARFQTTASIAALILSPLASVATTWVRLYYVQSMTLVLVALASLLLSFSLTSRPILSDLKHGYFCHFSSTYFTWLGVRTRRRCSI
ncbi:hypothetical protein KRP22_011377 [Phytophthora ramorum]|uniref:uncharacterized protein n=1 Tax=Phytophthora ramorum TaxID=164328 RepID=UPI0030AD7C17|nr:hypothetical protein KRP23_3166 [Phytophthora ramorum]KAH7499964.1 hypothetical protein KRP22_10578 [Phytophthora ramorum]